MTKQTKTAPPVRLVDFVRRQARLLPERSLLGQNNEQLSPLMIALRVQTVDANLKPVGLPFLAVSRSIIPKGVAFVHDEPPAARLAALQFELSDNEVNVLSEVLQCRSLGPYYLTDVAFLRRLAEFPTVSGRHVDPPALPDDGKQGNSLRDTTSLRSSNTQLFG